MQQPPLLSYRGGWLNSRPYLPDMTAIAKLGSSEKLMPYAFTVYDSATLAGGVLGAQQTDRGKYSTPEECWITHLVASSSQAAGFAVMFYDTDRQELWMAQPILSPNTLGTAQKPFWLRRPYKMPVNAQLQTKVTNLAAAGNAIQIVAWGVRK
jgi:hypothetical protein